MERDKEKVHTCSAQPPLRIFHLWFAASSNVEPEDVKPDCTLPLEIRNCEDKGIKVKTKG
jgi:hypothetical protein